MRKTLLFKVAAISIGVSISLVAAELLLRLQNFVNLDDFSDRTPWNNVLHHGRNKFTVTEFGSGCNGEKIKLLLLGDSWMEDGHLSNAIGQELADKSGKCVQAFNGGTTSYAPTLYLLKARQAFKAYGKFDYIVVNIDDTDVGDEWVRYRIPTVRDATGKIVAVPFNNDLHSEYLWNGKLWASDSDYYVIRLIRFTFFYKVLVPMLYKLTYCPDYPTLMQYLFAPDARSLFKKEHAFFGRRLLRMATKVSNFTTDASHVYVTYHPQRRGLVDTVDEGKLYLPIVSEALTRLQKKSGVTVLDARNYVRQIHGEAFSGNTFEPGDPFSHLLGDAATRYGKWIADQIVLK